jgi:hypothetical protein
MLPISEVAAIRRVVFAVNVPAVPEIVTSVSAPTFVTAYVPLVSPSAVPARTPVIAIHVGVLDDKVDHVGTPAVPAEST